eukprot:5438563-Amphidinium_carterae.1
MATWVLKHFWNSNCPIQYRIGHCVWWVACFVKLVARTCQSDKVVVLQNHRWPRSQLRATLFMSPLGLAIGSIPEIKVSADVVASTEAVSSTALAKPSNENSKAGSRTITQHDFAAM